MDNYIYTLGNSLYINLTNRCTNSCVFCVRTKTDNMGGQRLWLESEPTAEQVIKLIPDPEKYDEIVFCGFGEPTEKLDVLLEICRYLKKFRTPIRINTNGHASMIAGKDTAPMFKGLVDTIVHKPATPQTPGTIRNSANVRRVKKGFMRCWICPES